MLHCGKSIFKLGIMKKGKLDIKKMNDHFINCPKCRKAEDEAMKVLMHHRKKPTRKGGL